jgi:histidine triad (HIT) family protein
MPDDCIFCKIATGQIPSHKVHEDANVLAFLDIHPLRRGHTLIIPKRHRARYEDLSPEEASQLMLAVHALTPRVCGAVGAPSSTIAINNGKEAGQEVPHVHVHLVPRSATDMAGPIHALFKDRPQVAPDELPLLAQKIQSLKARVR